MWKLNNLLDWNELDWIRAAFNNRDCKHRPLSAFAMGSLDAGLIPHRSDGRKFHILAVSVTKTSDSKENIDITTTLRRMASSGTLCRVTLVRTDFSEGLSASFIRVTRIGELGTTLAVTNNRRTLRRKR
jgi:hypothetical protein